jgi:acetyl esterase/lipase
MRHRYGDHFHQFADLHLPPEPDGPLPVAVLLHAGFWREQYTLELSEDLARDLARRGWAAWNVEFRRVGEVSDGGYPATLEDVAAAIDFLQTLDAPLDLGRVVTIGQSACGHLALWAATREAPAVPLAGAVSQAGAPDLREADRLGLGDGAAAAFMGGHADDVPDAYADASPIEQLPLGVPQLLVHGEADDVIPASLSSTYAERAREAGDEVELVLRPGEDHFVHTDPANPAWQDVVKWLERFARGT